MHKLEIRRKKRIFRFSFPENFDELSAAQLEYIIPHLPEWTKAYTKYLNAKAAGFKRKKLADFQLQDVRIHALVYLTGVYKLRPWSRKGKAFFSMYPDEVTETLKLLNWLFDSPKRFEPPYSSLRVGFRKFYSPGNRFTALSGEEFHFAYRFFKQYQNGDQASLAKLIAILYRPKGKGSAFNAKHPEYSGDSRMPFNRHYIDELANSVCNLRQAQQMAILFWFGCCLRYYTQAYKEVFTKENEGHASQEGWLPIWRAMAKGMLQTEEVAQKRFTMILYELKELKREHREHKQRMAKLKVAK